MTDRYAGFVVSLREDIREDDAAAVVAAIRQLRGVVAVEPVISSPQEQITRARVDNDWRAKLYDLIKDSRTTP